MNKFSGLLVIGLLTANVLSGKTYNLWSPDKHIMAVIDVNDQVTYTVIYNNKLVLEKCPVALQVEGLSTFGEKAQVKSAKTEEINTTIQATVPYKNAVINDHCQQLTLQFKDNFSIIFRAYNDGIAYRFATKLQGNINVKNELVSINLKPDATVYFPEEKSMISHYECLYPATPLSQIADSQFCSLPVFFKTNDSISILFTETGLSDYPGLFLKGNLGKGLTSKFPHVIKEVKPHPRHADRYEIIVSEENYIAQTKGQREYPWRVFIIAGNDGDILGSNLVYALSQPLAIQNTSWIKPGKVAWDWWNANNIYGVDFQSGINNNTYQYYIDFASKFGLEYIILDEGWSKTTTNIMECTNEIDVEALVKYGQQRNVGVILWVLWKPLDQNLEQVLDLYKKWGVKGIKVDFMQRADQYMVNYFERVAKACAQRELLVDFHGAFKPSGLQRAYPNFISNEGVKGMENDKWSREVTPEHDVTLPFTRMMAGPMDYTPGAMDNAMGKNFIDRFDRPMSQGTRTHQVAMYVVFESPLMMLADNPSNYYREEPCTRFISQIPTTWDQTIALDSKIAQYVSVARRNGNKWYIGAMTNEKAREMVLDLSFLSDGKYRLDYCADGLNAQKIETDYKLGQTEVFNTTKLKVQLAPGGGYAGIITKIE